MPQQSGQSSQVNMKRLSPPKKDVCPEPLQKGQRGGFSRLLSLFVPMAILSGLNVTVLFSNIVRILYAGQYTMEQCRGPEVRGLFLQEDSRMVMMSKNGDNSNI